MNPAPSSYLLIFRDAGVEHYRALSPDQRQHLLARWNAWYDQLAEAGWLEQGRPLESPGRVVSGAKARVADGPYAEGKEAIGGFFLLTVESLDAATEIARACPGLPFGISVEVRPVADCCALLRAADGAPPAA